MGQKFIIIVNPAKAAGYAFCYTAKNIGLGVIALWTNRKTEEEWLPSLGHTFIDKTIYDSELNDNDYRGIIADNNVLAFISAEDTGFALADRLQSKFFPNRSNDQSLHKIRLNKFEYLDYLKEKGIVKTSQVIPQNLTELSFEGKKVLKPINGAGNDKIFFVTTPEDVSAVINKYKDTQFTLQDFVEGNEYCVELCAFGDIQKCTTVMKYGREYLVDNCSPWRYDNELIDPETDTAKLVIEYAKKVVSSLGVKVGLTWTQIKVQNGIPHLIECNFRSQGNGHIGAVYKSTGMSYAYESIISHIGSFEKFCATPMLYKKKGEFRKLSVNNRTERYIEKINFDEISSLSSVMAIWQNYFTFPGFAKKTTGFKNNLAVIIVCNESSEQYFSDIEKITEWQSKIEGTDEILKS